MKNSNKNSEETINYQLKMKRPVLLLLLGVLMCLPLTEAKANYYYKVQLQKADGTGGKSWSAWIYSEDLGGVWKNSLERLVKGETVRDANNTDIFLKKDGHKVYKVVGLSFQGRQEENYDILQSNDHKCLDSIRNEVEYLELRDWGKTQFTGSFYFADMKNLKEIVLPNNSFAIGDDAMFANCDNLTTITWGTNTTVTAIGKKAFSNCFKLKQECIQQMINEVSATGTGGNGIVYGKIGDEAFYQCREIETITIPTNISVIGYKAFCQNKEKSKFRQINLLASTIEIGKMAFQGCEVLETVVMSKAGNSYNQKITKLGEAAFADCRSISSASVNNIIASYAQNSLETIKINENGNEVKYIPAYLFYGCNGKSSTNTVQTNFTELTIPAEFGAIGKGAFGGAEGNHPIDSITVSKGVAPVCGQPEGDFLSGDRTSFQNIVPNKVTITFNGAANGYDKDGTSGYKTYQNEPEFKRLLTKTLDENNTTYDVYPQMHAIVELKRTFKQGWNTLALPFGSPSYPDAKDIDCAEIYKNALTPSNSDEFMIAVYRGLKKGTVFTFLKYAHVETDPLDEFEPILVKMSEADAKLGKYTFTDVDLNYDFNNKVLYSPKNLPGCVDSGGKKFYGNYNGDMPFFSGNNYSTFYFDGTFSLKKSDPASNFITPGDYIIQGGKFIECTADKKYALKGFRGWFKRETPPQNSKGNVITIELCDNDGTVTEIVNIDNNGNATIPYNIYNVYGQKVRGNTQSTEGLARGIYIVNGKKVMVK